LIYSPQDAFRECYADGAFSHAKYFAVVNIYLLLLKRNNSLFLLNISFLSLDWCVSALKCMPVSKKPRRDSARRGRQDTTVTFGFRGAGASWQAQFGAPLNERDLLFSVRREPVANRIVFQVAQEIFLKSIFALYSEKLSFE
jgi:hypothetical protein